MIRGSKLYSMDRQSHRTYGNKQADRLGKTGCNLPLPHTKILLFSSYSKINWVIESIFKPPDEKLLQEKSGNNYVSSRFQDSFGVQSKLPYSGYNWAWLPTITPISNRSKKYWPVSHYKSARMDGFLFRTSNPLHQWWKQLYLPMFKLLLVSESPYNRKF